MTRLREPKSIRSVRVMQLDSLLKITYTKVNTKMPGLTLKYFALLLLSEIMLPRPFYLALLPGLEKFEQKQVSQSNLKNLSTDRKVRCLRFHLAIELLSFDTLDAVNV